MTSSSTLGVRRRVAHPMLVLLSGHGGVAALTLARNIMAARLIGVEQFGIAASFAIIVSAVEMASSLGVQQMIVQDRDGENPEFQSALHLIQLLRGVLGAFAIYVSAGPVSNFMGLPHLDWAFRTLASIPLMMGLVHLDAWRYQRRERFGPSVWIQLGPAVFTLLLLWPLYVKFGDFRILLVASVAQASGVLVMSRLVSERRFLVSADPLILKRALKFGLPIAFNGFLLLLVFHGEKLMVAHLRGPGSLAILAMGFTLTLTPALILGKSLQSYMLPRLSACRGDADSFRIQSRQAIWLCTYLGAALALALALLAPAMPMLLGSDFVPLVALIPILAVLHGLRVIRTAASVIALARGKAGNAAIGNLPRIAALPIVYIALTQGASLAAILWLAVGAEAVGLAVSIAALNWRKQSLKDQ